jgi:hypothetical protein
VNATVERQIEELLAARNHWNGSAPLIWRARDRASATRRVLSIGNLPRLVRELRRLATAETESPWERTAFAILATQIESILARRKAEREARRKRLPGVATLSRAPKILPPYSAPGLCPECGQKPTRGGNGKSRVYCSPRCRSLAWTRRNRPEEYRRHRERESVATNGTLVATIRRGWDHETGGPTVEGVEHGGA